MPPGSYILVAAAAGFERAEREVLVKAGEATVLDPIILDATPPANASYKRVIGPIQGRFFCGFATPAIVGPCKLVAWEDPDHPVEAAWASLAGGIENNIFELPDAFVNKSRPTDVLERVVMEVKWTPTSGYSQVLLATMEMPDPEGRNATFTVDYARAHGESPLRLEVKPGVRNRTGMQAMSPSAAGVTLGVFPFPDGYYWEGNVSTPVAINRNNATSNPAGTVDTNRQGKLFPNGLHVGGSLYFEQRFTVYLTAFYNGPPPHGYTVFKG